VLPTYHRTIGLSSWLIHLTKVKLTKIWKTAPILGGFSSQHLLIARVVIDVNKFLIKKPTDAPKEQPELEKKNIILGYLRMTCANICLRTDEKMSCAAHNSSP